MQCLSGFWCTFRVCAAVLSAAEVNCCLQSISYGQAGMPAATVEGSMLERGKNSLSYLCRWVLHFEKSENGGPVICNSHVSDVIHQHLQRHASFTSDQVPITLQSTPLTPHAHDLACDFLILHDSRSTLSSPTGPSELFTMFATAATAMTFAVRTSWPEVLSPCNCNAPGPCIPAIALPVFLCPGTVCQTSDMIHIRHANTAHTLSACTSRFELSASCFSKDSLEAMRSYGSVQR